MNKHPRNRILIADIPYNGMRARPKCELFYYVAGSGEFPHDMLRYDSAIPATEDDARRMSGHGQRTVEMRAQGCTPMRWKSFGWTVLGDTFNAATVRERDQFALKA